MDLQVAIDRVTLERAVDLARQLDDQVDIIELGTSLIKDYGVLQIHQALPALRHAKLLLDIKTIDEGEYEFDKGFAAGDILTVMGAASRGTLEKVYALTQQRQKQMFIDMMEINDVKTGQIVDFPQAIYGIHHAKDAQTGFDAAATVAAFHHQYPGVQHISVAGGIDLAMAQKLAQQGLAESVIVGSAIVKTADPVATAQKFMEVMHS